MISMIAVLCSFLNKRGYTRVFYFFIFIFINVNWLWFVFWHLSCLFLLLLSWACVSLHDSPWNTVFCFKYHSKSIICRTMMPLLWLIVQKCLFQIPFFIWLYFSAIYIFLKEKIWGFNCHECRMRALGFSWKSRCWGWELLFYKWSLFVVMQSSLLVSIIVLLFSALALSSSHLFVVLWGHWFVVLVEVLTFTFFFTAMS